MDKVSSISQASAVSSSQSPEDERGLLASFKSLRRKKHAQHRLSPLPDPDPTNNTQHSPKKPMVASPRSIIPASHRTLRIAQREQQPSTKDDLDDPDNDHEEPTTKALSVEELKYLHAHMASEDQVERWIASYEADKTQFESFALFTEMKLDEIQGVHNALVGRPNAVELAACIASLWKMPGIVGCYKTLLEKLAIGIQSAVYHPQGSTAIKSAHELSQLTMTALVRHFYHDHTPYFTRLRDLETQLAAQRSLQDIQVLRTATIDEIAQVLTFVPFPRLQQGLMGAFAKHPTLYAKLLAFLQDNKQVGGWNHLEKTEQRLLGRSPSPDIARLDDDDDPDYPLAVPLCSSAQICRAIAQNASTFSSSGKEMILCSILEFVDVDSFRDVFKRFDSHGKTCFLHHLSVLESTDHLQMIVEQLPNAGETLFRFYAVTCTGNSDETSRAKHVFFHKVLSAEMEFYFLCDLAAYLNEDQWLLLSKEYDKNAQERRRRKRTRQYITQHQQQQIPAVHAPQPQELAIEEHGDYELDDAQLKLVDSSSIGSLEQFQLIVWNFLHQQRIGSTQVLGLIQSTMLPSLEERDVNTLMDYGMEQLSSVDTKWKRLLQFIEDLEISSSTGSATSLETTASGVLRMRMLKKLFGMLSREERTIWLEKTNKKFGVVPSAAPSGRKEARLPLLTDGALTNAPMSLEDPRPFVLAMKMDLKMLWIECLLDAIANDREYSARTALLKQVLKPFMSGDPQQQQQPQEPTKMTLAAAEKSINTILHQFTQAEKLRLWNRLMGDEIKRAKVGIDQATSPIPELLQQQTSTSSPSSNTVISIPGSSNPELAKLLGDLLTLVAETEVLWLLRTALDGAVTRNKKQRLLDEMNDPNQQEQQAEDDETAPMAGHFKRKVTALIAMSEPMEWQRYVKVGMMDAGCQTDTDELEPGTNLYQTSSTSRNSQATSARKHPPLTLSALIPKPSTTGGKKKESTKYQKINSAVVPRSIAGLITSWRMNTEQLVQFAKKPLSVVLKIIADAFGEMLTAGRRKNHQPFAATRSRELSLAQIVYQSFLHSYGLPGIADMHLLAFSCAIETFRSQHLRVDVFARFCFEEVPRQELQNYIEFLETLVCDDAVGVGAGSTSTSGTGAAGSSATTGASGAGSSSSSGPSATTTSSLMNARRQRFVPRVVVPDKENWMLPLEKAQEAAQLCFRAMRKSTVAAFCDRLAVVAAAGTSASIDIINFQTVLAAATANSTSPPSNPSDLVINADFLLQMVLHEWRDEQVRRENHLLDAFRAGDVNGDGQLTSAEFTQIVLSIDRNRDLGEILLMYSDTIRRVECEAINTEVFLQVARENELDKMAWNEDGDLRNITNNVDDLEATWQQVKCFFLGTLEALVRDLTTHHFLRVCEGAGCGCLKCILDGYIGFQRMRREYMLSLSSTSYNKKPGKGAYPVSETLVWGRFWHLMRQLYEASNASDGILTPWDGAEYMRIEPVPPMAPRLLPYRRNALPNFLFPDTNRISGMMKRVHVVDEAFDAEEINRRFVDLLTLMTYREAPLLPTG